MGIREIYPYWKLNERTWGNGTEPTLYPPKAGAQKWCCCRVWIRMDRFIWLWPMRAWMRITLCDEVRYFDITSPPLYFLSSILSRLRRVSSLTTFSEGKEKVRVLNGWDIFKVEAVISLILLMARLCPPSHPSTIRGISFHCRTEV